MSNEKNKKSDLASVKGRPEFIGPYRLLGTLGEGGMSVVYLAEQNEPVKRRVALKILKPGMDSKQVVARFESERQALAVLDHPNIAKIFDGGITEFGRPYFVMERVQGIPITDYCDDQRLSTEERVGLFIEVCSAVQHAHHKGLIHRDLKPSNILVGVVDSKPMVKVIDFGIAKAAIATLTEQTLLTKIGQVIGTPQYMSPEQADTSGLDVDTRTDIYSLGVVLYELLVGIVPLDLAAIGDHAMRLALREKDPQKPSTRVTELGDSQDEIARVRNTDPMTLKRQLQGDLDWIVMQAIAKDRTRRYETANALAVECRRYLKHEPVIARPPSVGYLLQRFVRRNRLMVTAAAIAIIAVIAGATAATLGFIRATEAEQVAVSEAATARETTKFLVDLFQVSDPSEARGNSITAREILDRGAEDIETGLDDQPEVQATLMMTIGKVYQNLGLLKEAEDLLEKSLEIQRREFAEPDENIASVLHELTGVNIFQGDLDVAESFALEALEMRRAVFGSVNEEVAHVISNLAVIEYYRSNYTGAAKLFEEALVIFEQTLGSDHPDVINTTGDLGVLYSSIGRLDDAVRLFKLSLEGKRQHLGDDHPDIAVIMGNLAIALKNLGRIDEAREMYLESFDLQKKQLGEHRLVANTMNNIGMFMLQTNDLNGAERMLHDAHDMWIKTLGTENVKVSIAKHNLGQLYLAKNDLELAESFLEEAAAGRQVAVGNDHEDVAWSRMYLAEVYIYTGRAELAEPMIRHSVEIFERTLPEGHTRISSARMRLGASLIVQGREAEGEPLLLENYKAIQIGAPDSMAADRTRIWMVRFFNRIGMPEEADKYRN